MWKAFVVGGPFLLVCALATCSVEHATDVERRPHHDAEVTPDSPPTTTGGTVTCYTEGNPGQTCTLPVHCCFTSYSAQHDGTCTTSTCAYGTIDCDGPEDCVGGERCCSQALLDGDGALVGYTVACQASACGAPPLAYELCHPDGPACSNGGTCTTAYGTANDLPRTLYVCE